VKINTTTMDNIRICKFPKCEQVLSDYNTDEYEYCHAHRRFFSFLRLFAVNERGQKSNKCQICKRELNYLNRRDIRTLSICHVCLYKIKQKYKAEKDLELY